MTGSYTKTTCRCLMRTWHIGHTVKTSTPEHAACAATPQYAHTNRVGRIPAAAAAAGARRAYVVAAADVAAGVEAQAARALEADHALRLRAHLLQQLRRLAFCVCRLCLLRPRRAAG